MGKLFKKSTSEVHIYAGYIFFFLQNIRLLKTNTDETNVFLISFLPSKISDIFCKMCTWGKYLAPTMLLWVENSLIKYFPNQRKWDKWEGLFRIPDILYFGPVQQKFDFSDFGMHQRPHNVYIRRKIWSFWRDR